jgi:quercetin dioxygenase-like cupin family protein/hemerythrin-like domain-containing protein
MERYSLAFKEKLVSPVATVEDCKFVQLSMEEGQGLTKHRTPHNLNFLVLSGRVRFTVGDEELSLESGDMVTVEPNHEHAVYALEKSVALLMLVPEKKIVESAKPAEPALDHENAFMNPELIEKVAPELRPFVEDHIEVCRVIESVKGDVDAEKVQVALNVIGKELKHHFVAEEELLFPLMAKHVGGMDVGPVARLIEEHKKIRKLHGEAGELLDIYMKQESDHMEALLGEKVKELSHSLLNHLGKEDSHLFPMASRLLTDEEKQSVAEGLPKYE